MSAQKAQHKDAATKMWDLTNDDYEKFRPSHDAAGVKVLLEHLGLLDNVTQNNGTPATYDVLDVGAGTGKCTRVIKELLGKDARIIAIDPVPGMIQQLKAHVPGVDAVVGSCESLPLPDNSVKAVVSSQSFHFYANVTALREVHRVLVPGGKFGINFTADDEDSPLIHGVYELIRKYMYPECPENFLNPLLDLSWKNCFDAAPGLFTPLQEHIMPWENQQTLPDAESVVKLFMTYSAIAREPELRKECAERMYDFLTTDPAIPKNGAPLEITKKSALYWCTKKHD